MNKFLGLIILLSAISSLQADVKTPKPKKKGYGPGEQEYGYVDVRKGAHMFYWLFYVQNPNVTDRYSRPLVMWLQGGPGGSSVGQGNFEEIGPLFVNGTARPTSWAKHVNLLFIDNPVGAGFSYVDDIRLLTKTNSQIGKDMVSFLSSFYKMYPKFEKSPLYIYGESYGGKMAVKIAKKLLMAIKRKKIKMNFKGIALGDPWISPMDSVNTWGNFLLQMGLVDANGFREINDGAAKIQKAVDNGQWKEATRLWGQLQSTVKKETSNVDFYNIFYNVHPEFEINSAEVEDRKVSFTYGNQQLQNLMDGPVKKALGIPANVVYSNQSLHAFNALAAEHMKSVVHTVEELLDNTDLKIIVYSGNFDLIVDTPGTVMWIDKMKWSGSGVWKIASRKLVVVNNYIEGYVKHVENFYLYWVHRAGHRVPADNPECALEILRRTTGFDKL